MKWLLPKVKLGDTVTYNGKRGKVSVDTKGIVLKVNVKVGFTHEGVQANFDGTKITDIGKFFKVVAQGKTKGLETEEKELWRPFIEKCTKIRDEIDFEIPLAFNKDRDVLFTWNMKHANNRKDTLQSTFDRFKNMVCMLLYMCKSNECTPSFVVIQECNEKDGNSFIQKIVEAMRIAIPDAEYKTLSMHDNDVKASEYDIIYASSKYTPGNPLLAKEKAKQVDVVTATEQVMTYNTNGYVFCTFKDVASGKRTAIGTTHIPPLPRCVNELYAYEVAQQWDKYVKVLPKDCKAVLAGDFNTQYKTGRWSKDKKFYESNLKQVCTVWSDAKLTKKENRVWGQASGAPQWYYDFYDMKDSQKEQINQFKSEYEDVVYRHSCSTSLLGKYIYDGIVMKRPAVEVNIYLSCFPDQHYINELKELQSELKNEAQIKEFIQRDAFMNAFGDHYIVGAEMI